MCMHVCACVYACVCVCVCMCVHVCMHVCACVCPCTHVCVSCVCVRERELIVFDRSQYFDFARKSSSFA